MAESHDISLEDRQRALSAAIERLYVVFHRREPAQPIEYGSPDELRLASTPLRKLSLADLEPLSHKAMTTLGTFDDFRYFLPRLLELVAVQWTGGQDFRFFVFSKLGYEEVAWKPKERAALDEYLLALWLSVLAVGTWQRDVSDCLTGVAEAVDDLTPWLDAWENDASASARRSLAAMIQAAPDLIKRRSIIGLREEQSRQVLKWICDSRVGSILEQMFFQADDGELESELSLAIELIKSLRNLPRG